MENVRTADLAKLTAEGGRAVHMLLNPASGSERIAVRYVRTAPGHGSPEGMHTHTWDQILFILKGTMEVEIEGKRESVPAGSLAFFPKGARHRQWNEGSDATLHLVIQEEIPA